MISKKSENYGRALFNLVSDEETLQALKSLSEALKEKRFFEFFDSRVISLEDKKQVLAQVLKQASDPLKKFLFLLLDKQAFSFLPEVVQVYDNLLDEKNSRVKGVIYSSSAISKEEKATTEKVLGKFLNKKVDLITKQDENLIGGLYIKVGDYIFNDTLQGHFKKFQSSGGH